MTVAYLQITSAAEQKLCLDIRKAVFVDEQNVAPDLEIDGLDDAAMHFLAIKDGKAVATARVRRIGDAGKIERVAVLKPYRGAGIGAGLIEHILQDLKYEIGIKTAKLGSQTHAIDFYERLGFTAIGDEYMDADIPHYDMVLNLEEYKTA